LLEAFLEIVFGKGRQVHDVIRCLSNKAKTSYLENNHADTYTE